MPNVTRILSMVFCCVFILFVCGCEGHSLFCYLKALFLFNTWKAIATEITEHKLLYFGNVCCIVFVYWVSWRISRHGRPIQRRPMDDSKRPFIPSKFWGHFQFESLVNKKPIDINVYISCDVLRQDTKVQKPGADKEFLIMKNAPPPIIECCSTDNAGRKKARTSKTAKHFTSHSSSQSAQSTKSEILVTKSWNAARSGSRQLTSSESCYVSSTFGMATQLLSDIKADVASRDNLFIGPPKVAPVINLIGLDADVTLINLGAQLRCTGDDYCVKSRLRHRPQQSLLTETSTLMLAFGAVGAGVLIYRRFLS